MSFEDALPPEFRAPKPRKSESVCPACGAERSPTDTVCQACGYNGAMQQTQNLTPYQPDPEKQNTTPQGYRISNLIFDSKNKRFITANESNNLFVRYREDENEADESLGREKAHPGFDADDRENRSWESKEFHSLEKPKNQKPDKDELEEQFKALAIDG